MGHVNAKISPSGEEAVVWFGDDESDVLHMEGPATTIDAVCRALKANESSVEHEISQRGANRDPFVSDLTKAEIDAAEKVAAKAKAAADVQSKSAAIKEQLDVIEKARAALAALAPEALADADAIAGTSATDDGSAAIVAMNAHDAIEAIAKVTSVDALDRLGEAEAATKNKNRKTVLDAIDARITEITKPA